MISNTCVFCKIISKEVDAGILYEDEHILAFLDIQPVNEGHCLVIPKKHYERIEDIVEENIYLSLFRIGRNLMVKIQNIYSDVTAFNLLVANGSDAGQDVFHVHLHIIPRKPNDGFGFKFGPSYGKTLTSKDKMNISEKILKI